MIFEAQMAFPARENEQDARSDEEKPQCRREDDAKPSVLGPSREAGRLGSTDDEALQRGR